MPIVPEWELNAHIQKALDVLAADLDSEAHEVRLTAAVNLIDNCLEIIRVQNDLAYEDSDGE